jgi:NADPH:quinone reductase-like Zn-dependent oxidoreductase
MSDRAFQLHRSASGFDLRQTQSATPEPGPGEVLMRVRAVSLNRRDISIRDLSYPTFGDAFMPLSDAAGEVVSIGTGVDGVAPGDHVTSTFFQNWPDGRISLPAVMSSLGAGGRGVLADHVVLSAGGVAPIPAGLDFAAAACLPCAAVTAWSGLFTHGALAAGDWVLVIGTGGVALFGLQLAVAAGAQVAVISSSDEKLERARTLGATLTVNYQTTPDWETAVREATGGVGHVLELGGAGTLAKSTTALGVGGHMALIGGLAGFGGDLSAVSLVMSALRVTAISVGSRAEHMAMAAFVARHGIAPQIDSVFDLDAVEEAYTRAAAGAFGKVVIRLS